METGAKSVLYRTIEKLGKERIESQIMSTPSNAPEAIKDIFSACVPLLGPVDHRHEGVYDDLVVALMHYLLTVSLIQAERKVEYGQGLTLDIVIPSVKQLRAHPKCTLLLAFPKTDATSAKAQNDKLQNIQSKNENIWFIFGRYNDQLINACKDFRTYIPDELAKGSLRALSSIIDDIRSFLKTNGIKSFKIFPS